MNRQKLNERLKKEFEEFKSKILKLSKEEIFENGFEIDLFGYLTNYLTDSSTYLSDKQIYLLENFESNILDEFYNLYMNNDCYYIYEDMCDELVDYFSDMYSFDTETTNEDEIE